MSNCLGEVVFLKIWNLNQYTYSASQFLIIFPAHLRTYSTGPLNRLWYKFTFRTEWERKIVLIHINYDRKHKTSFIFWRSKSKVIFWNCRKHAWEAASACLPEMYLWLHITPTLCFSVRIKRMNDRKKGYYDPKGGHVKI